MRPIESHIEVTVSRQCPALSLDDGLLRRAICRALEEGQVSTASVSLAIVDDATIHDLNRRFLAHDYPTDVLSFVLEQTGDWLEAEIVVSAETAAREASGYEWSAEEELLLYVVHGALHLAGFDDRSPADKAQMDAAQRRVMDAGLAKGGLAAAAARGGHGR